MYFICVFMDDTLSSTRSMTLVHVTLTSLSREKSALTVLSRPSCCLFFLDMVYDSIGILPTYPIHHGLVSLSWQRRCPGSDLDRVDTRDFVTWPNQEWPRRYYLSIVVLVTIVVVVVLVALMIFLFLSPTNPWVLKSSLKRRYRGQYHPLR